MASNKSSLVNPPFKEYCAEHSGTFEKLRNWNFLERILWSKRFPHFHFLFGKVITSPWRFVWRVTMVWKPWPLDGRYVGKYDCYAVLTCWRRRKWVNYHLSLSSFPAFRNVFFYSFLTGLPSSSVVQIVNLVSEHLNFEKENGYHQRHEYEQWSFHRIHGYCWSFHWETWSTQYSASFWWSHFFHSCPVRDNSNFDSFDSSGERHSLFLIRAAWINLYFCRSFSSFGNERQTDLDCNLSLCTMLNTRRVETNGNLSC